MDRIRTLLLARTHVVVMDHDVVAGAATRPARDDDVERFEDELAQHGFVMSLDLAITIRRLPRPAILELRGWMLATLVTTHAPMPPASEHQGTLYARRILAWLGTAAEHPCPWCGELQRVGALDPCGHLVCRTCWQGGSYAGCPICHRRVPPGDPFLMPAPSADRAPDRALRVLHLGFDLAGTTRARFERLISRATPLSVEERAEVETVIDTLGPKVAVWLPRRIPSRETMAIVVARLWMVAPDRHAIARATTAHLVTATDVLRVAVVLLGRSPSLVPDPDRARLGNVSRRLRRSVLEALDRLPADALVEEVGKHRSLWQRVGERLHPFEHAKRLPTAALAFAVARGTQASAVTFGATLRAHANQLARARVEDERVRVTSWGALVEEALRARELRGVAERLAQRPAELLARADLLVRLAQDAPPETTAIVTRAIHEALARGAPETLLVLARHLARRATSRTRRVFVRRGRRAWRTRDRRPALQASTIATLRAAIEGELLSRAEAKRHFARAVIDRGLPAHLWELASLHAVARANSIYVRERDGRVAQYRRRDGEAPVERLARVRSAADDDGTLAAVPVANAPTWLAVIEPDLAIPAGSEVFSLEGRPAPSRVTEIELVSQLGPLARMS